MSSLNNTTNSIQAEEISDQIQVITYCEIGLSIVSIFANLANFFAIRKKFITTFVYHIQQIDSIVTAVSQIGFIVILLNSISSTPNATMCTLGSALAVTIHTIQCRAMNRMETFLVETNPLASYAEDSQPWSLLL